MQVILRNNGNGRKDAVYVVATEPGPEGCTKVIAYYGKWASYESLGIFSLNKSVKYVAGPGLWQSNFDKILSAKVLRGYVPVDADDLTPRVSSYLKFRGYDLEPPTIHAPAPPAFQPKPAPEPEPKPARKISRASALEL